MPTDAITGSFRALPTFSNLDQRFRLKMRGFVDTFMPSFNLALMDKANLDALRKDGIFPLMFFLDFESMPYSLRQTFQEVDYAIQLFRFKGEDNGGDRLLLNMEGTMRGEEGSGKPEHLFHDQHQGKKRVLAKARVVMALTRPTAPPGQRQVASLPQGASLLAEQPWEEPYPSPEELGQPPAGWRREGGKGTAGVHSVDGVWGIPHTDPNQHVNVLNYIIEAENMNTRLLHEAGVPPQAHHLRRGRMVFRKPFFAGDTFRVSGQLFSRGGKSILLCGFHKGSADQAFDPRPSVVIRLEGEQEKGA
ncbi:MAG: hypothetical protein OEV94_10960 [Deltaproteobacteria bacterium]|nr:hypothetical protein [Deltaproteobacteria bacterium]